MSSKSNSDKMEDLVHAFARRVEDALNSALDDLNPETENAPYEKNISPKAPKLRAKLGQLGGDILKVASQGVTLIRENPKEIAAVIAGVILVAEVGDIEDGLEELAETGEYDPSRANAINL